MSLKQNIAQYWEKIQGTLFPILEELLPPLTQKQQQLVSILEVLRIEEFIFPTCPGFRGRPEKSRRAILRAFVAKAIYNIPTTRMLIERLHSDASFRRICGFELRSEIPSESVFCRTFAEFAATELLIKVHEELIKTHYSNEIIGHIITDSSAIEAREKAAKKIKEVGINKPKNPGGRPKKGQEKPKEMTRIEKQALSLLQEEKDAKPINRQVEISSFFIVSFSLKDKRIGKILLL